MASRPAPTVLVALVALVLLGSEAAAQCSGPTCHELTGDIYDGQGGPFLSGHTYVITGPAQVPGTDTLTIQPGAVIKVKSAYFHAAGLVQALGTAAEPIVITSYKDDTVGGDSNGDGAASSPAPGDYWPFQIQSAAAGSLFQHVEWRYGSYVGTAAAVTFDHVTVRDHSQYGLRLNGVSGVYVTHSHFERVPVPMFEPNPHAIDEMWGNTASDCDQMFLRVIHGGSLFGDQSWGPENMLNGTQAIVLDAHLKVWQGATLTFEPGVVVKLTADRDLEIQGSLKSLGSAAQPVVLTSVDDHDYGGATGSGTPAPGDWGSLQITGFSSANEVRHTVLRYGGKGAGHHGLVDVQDDMTIEASLFEHSYSEGVQFGSHIDIAIVDCHFQENAVTTSPARLDLLADWSGNTATGNTQGDMLSIQGTIQTSATLRPEAAYNNAGTFLMTGSNTVSGAGNTLTIEPGVILKGLPAVNAEIRVNSGARLQIGGVGPPVVFTSVYDDSHGGDTNNDGAATSPAPGDWYQVALVYADDSSTIENTLIRYAHRGVGTVGTDPTISDTTIELCAAEALSGFGTSLPRLENCAFDQCGGPAPLVELPIDALPQIVGCTAAGNTTSNSLWIDDLSPMAPITLAPANTLNGNGVVVVGGASTVYQPLTLEAGMILKMAHTGTVNPGAIVCNGTPTEPVVFTSLDDDLAEDTDGSGGPPSEGTPGSWGGLAYYLQSASSLSHVLVRNAGAQGRDAIELAFSSPTFDHVAVERSAEAALSLDGNSHPVITQCRFDDNARITDGLNLAHLNTWSDNTASGNAAGDHLRVGWMGWHPTGGWNLQRGATTNGDGVLFVGGSWDVGTFESLTIGGGMVLKWLQPGGLIEVEHNGVFTADGNQAHPIVMTSVHDDAFGGDDGDPTAPAPGDWTGLRFRNTSADGSVLLDHVRIRYAGHLGTPSIELDDAQATICNSTVEMGAGHGIDTSWNSQPQLKNVTIDDHTGDAVHGITWNVLGGIDGIQASGNADNLENVVIDSPVVIGPVHIERENMLGACIVVNVSPSTDEGSLHFGRGVVLKAGSPAVGFEVGSISGTGMEKVVFTSIYDDSVAGDTNGDGSATQPAPGDWLGVICSSTKAEHVLVRYAGAPSNGSPHVGLHASAVGARVEHCAGDGLRTGVAENCVAFMNGGDGISRFDGSQGSFHIGEAVGCTSVRNGGYGFSVARATYCIGWNNGATGAPDENFWWTEDIVLCQLCGTDATHCIGTDVTVSPPVPNHFTNCPNTGWGNLFVDPLFVDEAGGDLRLSPTSPARDFDLVACPSFILQDTGLCKPLGWGLSGTGYPDDPPGSRDHDENPRWVDDALSGVKLADVGAYERVLWRLEVEGEPVLGGDQWLGVQGPAGTAWFLLSLPAAPEDDFLHVAFGWLMLDPAFLFVAATLPVGVDLAYSLPGDPVLAGLEIGVQAGVAPAAAPVLKEFTNLYRPRFRF